MKSLKLLVAGAILVLGSATLKAQTDSSEMTKQIELKLVQAEKSFENLKAMAAELNELSKKIIEANLNTGDERALLDISATIEELGMTTFISGAGVKGATIAFNLTEDTSKIARIAASGKGYATPAAAVAGLATYVATKYLTKDERNIVYNADLKTNYLSKDYSMIAARYVAERKYLSALVQSINETTNSKLVAITCEDCPEVVVGSDKTKFEMDFDDIQL